MRPFGPKASSSTFTIGTRQLVVQEASETTSDAAGRRRPSLTPMTNVASGILMTEPDDHTPRPAFEVGHGGARRW